MVLTTQFSQSSVTFVEGWTGRIQVQLFADGAAFDLTGCTVQLILYTSIARPAVLAGVSSIVTADQGLVAFDPAATDLIAAQAPYAARWQVTDANGKVTFFPDGLPDKWMVRKP